MTKKHLKEPSGGDRENEFEKGECPESSKVERQGSSNCKRDGVNPAISAKGTTPNKN